MKNIKYLLILFLVFIGINNVKAVDPSLKVYDYAQVLTPTEESNLKLNIESYINNYNMDMALVTVRQHNKSNTMNYADDFYDYNGFGIGSNYDGVIFVIDFTFGYKDIWMSTTGKAIDIYTDERIDYILDSVASKVNYGYYEMLNEFIQESAYYASMGVPAYGEAPVQKTSIFTILLISAIIPTIIIVILILRNRMVKASTTASEYLIKNSVLINNRADRFITTHTTKVLINDSSGSSGSRSSTHRSSSGRSHGGGGRRL